MIHLIKLKTYSGGREDNFTEVQVLLQALDSDQGMWLRLADKCCW